MFQLNKCINLKTLDPLLHPFLLLAPKPNMEDRLLDLWSALASVILASPWLLACTDFIPLPQDELTYTDPALPGPSTGSERSVRLDSSPSENKC